MATRRVAMVAPRTGRLSLSDRFALIRQQAMVQGGAAGTSLRVGVSTGAAKQQQRSDPGAANRAGRAAAAAVTAKAKRQAKQEANRGKKGSIAAAVKPTKKAAAAARKAAAEAEAKSGKKSRSVKAETKPGKAAKAKATKAKAAEKKEKPKPKTQEEMDFEIAMYQHKGERRLAQAVPTAVEQTLPPLSQLAVGPTPTRRRWTTNWLLTARRQLLSPKQQRHPSLPRLLRRLTRQLSPSDIASRAYALPCPTKNAEPLPDTLALLRGPGAAQPPRRRSGCYCWLQAAAGMRSPCGSCSAGQALGLPWNHMPH